MSWIKEFYEIEYRIENINSQIVYAAQKSYAISTEKALKKIINLMLYKKDLLKKYIEYKSKLDSISTKIKNVLDLRYRDNKTRKEVSKLLNISERTINRWINKVEN